MIHTFRAYIPDFDVQQNSLLQVANTTLSGRVLETKTPPDLNFKKIYCFAAIDYLAYPVWQSDYDLVATLNGVEVYRQPLARQSSTNLHANWRLGVDVSLQNIQDPESAVLIVGANQITYEVPVIKLHLMADTFYLDPIAFSSGNWDLILFVMSQKGI